MKRKALPAIVLVIACLGGACGGTGSAVSSSTPPTSTSTSTSRPPTAATSPTTSAPTTSAANTTFLPSGGDGAPSEDMQECNRFTILLDRFVFNRLQPIVDEASELLHSPSEDTDGGPGIAGGLFRAADQVERLVEEIDRMGVPPREAVDLLLSIREAVQHYAAGFEKGGRGWESGDIDLIREAQSDIREAGQVLGSFFGWDLCG